MFFEKINGLKKLSSEVRFDYAQQQIEQVFSRYHDMVSLLSTKLNLMKAEQILIENLLSSFDKSEKITKKKFHFKSDVVRRIDQFLSEMQFIVEDDFHYIVQQEISMLLEEIKIGNFGEIEDEMSLSNLENSMNNLQFNQAKEYINSILLNLNFQNLNKRIEQIDPDNLIKENLIKISNLIEILSQLKDIENFVFIKSKIFIDYKNSLNQDHIEQNTLISDNNLQEKLKTVFNTSDLSLIIQYMNQSRLKLDSKC